MNHDDTRPRNVPGRAPRRRTILALTALLAVATALGAGSAAAGSATVTGVADPSTTGSITHPVPGNVSSHPIGDGTAAIDCFEPEVDDCPELSE